MKKFLILPLYISGFLLSACTKGVNAPVALNVSPSVVPSPSPIPSGKKLFANNVLSFYYPAEWNDDDQAPPDYYAFMNKDGRVMTLTIAKNVDKSGNIVKPSDYFYPKGKNGDVKKNENSIDNHQAIEFLSNPQSLDGPQNESVVISVPEKSAIIILEFAPGAKNQEMEKQIQNTFVPILSTIKIHN